MLDHAEEAGDVFAAFELAGHAFAKLDAAGRYAFVSAAYAAPLGYAPSELLGRHWAVAAHPGDRAAIRRAHDDATGRGEAEARGLRKDGAVVRRRLTFVARRGPEGEARGHYCFALEAPAAGPAGAAASGAERAREAAAAAERFRSLVDALPQLVWEADLATGEVFLNARWYEYTGLDAEQCRGRGSLEAVHPDDRESSLEHFARASAAGEPYEIEFRVRHAAGAYRWHLARAVPVRDASGAVARLVGTSTDVDDQRRAADAAREEQGRLEAAVRERAAELAAANRALRREMDERARADEVRLRLAAVVESSPDAILRVDLDGRVESCNAAAERLYGLSADDLVGRPALDLVHPSHHDLALEIAARVLTRGTSEPHELLHCGAGGRPVAVAVSAAPIRDAAGGVAGAALIVRDVGAAKDAERQVRASLQEKEVLLMEVHHRVKNNLQVISSLLGLQASRLTDPVALETLNESQNRVRSIALAHEKLYQSKDLARIDLAAHVRDVGDNLLGTYGHGALDYDLDEAWLGLDEAIPCGLIVNELVSNALKHAFRGRAPGRVLVTLRRLPGGELRLRVDDDGVGLPAGFDPKRSNSLGLKLVGTLARQLRGALRVGSQGGASFELAFAPAAGEARPRSAA